EFHPSQIALSVLQQVELQPVDQHGVQFPVLPIPHPPEQLKSAENTSANTIPSNKSAMLEELDPGPKTIEEDTEEMWSDEGYLSPIGEEDSFSSPILDDKARKLLKDTPLDTPAANTRKGTSKAKPPKPPNAKKSGKARTSSPSQIN
ncbi:unnamed protein product, partial [Cuscuta campestris]